MARNKIQIQIAKLKIRKCFIRNSEWNFLDRYRKSPNLNSPIPMELRKMLTSLLFLVSSVLQYPCELCIVEHAIFDGGFPVHLIYFIVSEPVTHRG